MMMHNTHVIKSLVSILILSHGMGGEEGGEPIVRA